MANFDDSHRKVIRGSIKELLDYMRRPIFQSCLRRIRDSNQSKLYDHVFMNEREGSISVYINTMGRAIPDDNAELEPIIVLRLSDHDESERRDGNRHTETLCVDSDIWMVDQDESEKRWEAIGTKERNKIYHNPRGRKFFIKKKDAGNIVSIGVRKIMDSIDKFVKTHDP